MNYTENYQLNQWVESDRVLMKDFNADNTKIDAALTEIGAFRIETGTYVGTGKSTGGPLTFTGTPIFVVVGCTKFPDLLLMFQGGTFGTSIVAEAPNVTTKVGKMYTFWDGKSVTWSKYYTEMDDRSAMDQKDVTYRYIALVSVT